MMVASNNEGVLQNNLLRSPDLEHAREIVVERNPLSASNGYNKGLINCSGDVIIFAHQDVFLPTRWTERLLQSVEAIAATDPNWGVAGVYGVTENGEGAGYVYSTGLGRFVGNAFDVPIQVRTMDEMVIIIRRSSGLKFDENLPGFHLYGTDICLVAESLGMRNYVLPCFALHNSMGIQYLPMSFWRAYHYLRNKWKERLPIVTPCTTITYGCMPIFRHLVEALLALMIKKKKLGLRADDAERFYADRISPVIER